MLFSSIARETIDGGLDYLSDELISKVVENAAGEPSSKESAGRGMQKKKNRDPDIEIRRYILFSDQSVESVLLGSVTEELEKKRPKVIAHTDHGTSIQGSQIAGVLKSAAVVTAQHDSLR